MFRIKCSHCQEGCNVCTCGYARYGRLGHGTSDDHSFDTICKPVSRFTGARVSSLACGAAHNVLLLSDSRTFVWGKCHYGQLDLGHEWMVRHHHARPFAYSVVCCVFFWQDVLSPTQLKFDAGSAIVAVGAGTSHTMAISQAGRLYTWVRWDNSWNVHGILLR